MKWPLCLQRGSFRTAIVLSATTLGCLSLAAPAQAAVGPATVRIDIGRLIYSAAPDQTNHLSVTLVSNHVGVRTVYLIDDVYEIRATGRGCTHPRPSDLTRVRCTVSWASDSGGSGDGAGGGGGGASSYGLADMGRFLLRDGDDTVRVHNPKNLQVFNTFWLGPGNDTAITRQPGKLRDTSAVYGQDGNDHVVAGRPSWLSLVQGGNGDDWISMRGPARTPDDGTSYFHGNGTASGGNGDDQLFGGQGRQTLSGGAGNDLIDGGDGDDELNGGAGDDQLWGRKGNDTILGGTGNDQLHGGLGRDRLVGGPGWDVTVAR